MTTSLPSITKGVEIIREAVKKLDGKPGVYRMLDAEGKALYVGKAKDLKKRVTNYTQMERLPLRIQRMVSHTCSMEFVIATSEAEALLLEANLIKELRPPFNILLKDDKSYPYICIDKGHAYPRIMKYRGAKKPGYDYYGPFASAGAVNRSLHLLQKLFLLRPCTDSVFSNRTRPCLQFHIKRCSAPCVQKINEENYTRLVEQARDFLSGRSQEVQKRLSIQMEEASHSMRYEEAAALRDRLKALAEVQHGQRFQITGVDNADVLALGREGGWGCVQCFMIRGGLNVGNRPYLFKLAEDQSDEEVLETFIGQYYQRYPCPEMLLVSERLSNAVVLEQALGMKEKQRIQLLTPQRGDKKEAVAFAQRNAVEALRRKLAEESAVENQLERVAEIFKLPTPPRRIEIYDNSHIMGRHALGVMVVATPQGFQPSSYRTFNRKDLTATAGDDYGLMREVMRRRFRQLTPENTPELLIIDGGAGQLTAVREALAEMGLSEIPTVAMSKGPERNAGREFFHMPNLAPFQLPQDDPALHYLQRLRDEAHRFAIGTHRKKRGKAMVESSLDSVPGIGAKRKKALLHHFGSFKAIREASVEELCTVEGVHDKMAQIIHDYFHTP